VAVELSSGSGSGLGLNAGATFAGFDAHASFAGRGGGATAFRGRFGRISGADCRGGLNWIRAAFGAPFELGHIFPSARDFGLGCAHHGFAGPGKGIGPGCPVAATSPTTVRGAGIIAGPAPLAASRACGSSLGGLGPLLGHQLIKLARFELLGQGAERETEHGHRGAEAEGLLQGPATAVAVSPRQHDLTRAGPLLQEGQVGLRQGRSINQQIVIGMFQKS
jgi:hypothetical protein